jgi:hypothetical protein
MNEPEPPAEALRNLIDDYLSGLLDEAGMGQLEAHLRADAEARRYFVRYALMHTHLYLEARARLASDRILDTIERLAESDATPAGGRAPRPGLLRRCLAPRFFVPAACLLLAVGAGWWLWRGRLDREPAIAWLVNAQSCRWAAGEPAGDMRAGKVLKLEHGLAEIRFQCGARVVLEGPAGLELLSGNASRLMYGKLTARVPGPAAGFEVLSPQGKVIDLGTEFGISVSDGGATDVYVFEGKVEAHAAADGPTGAVSLTQNQAARISAGKVTLRPGEPGAGADRFVRAIVPPPVILPRSLRLTFDRPAAAGIRDAGGLATGLTHRLPGTGSRLPGQDPNLRLDAERGELKLTTTKSDINTQHRLDRGEYLGVRLADLGFTGKEDFEVTACIPNIPALEAVGQFGLYAGSRSDKNIRGGLLGRVGEEPGRYWQFLVNNDGGSDENTVRIGLLSTGNDLRVTLRRTGGKYALIVENLTEGSASTLTIRHPEFLDEERDLYVGLFGANTQSDVRKTLVIKEFSATVWTVSPSAGAAH